MQSNGQAQAQPTPGNPAWLDSQLQYRDAGTWPEGVMARYLTVAGATVDITYASHNGLLTATCTGCGQIERTDTGGLLTDPPEKEEARAEKALPEIRELAQAHASECRALPRPAGA